MTLSNKYYAFAGLLLNFHTPGLEDEEVILQFAHTPTFNKEDLQTTLSQIKEVLMLDPFPDKWISDNTGYRLPPSLIDTPEEYKKWVAWMGETLEEEAKKAGKL